MDLPKITQLHNYLQEELQKKKEEKDEIIKDQRTKRFLKKDCLGVYLIILKDSP